MAGFALRDVGDLTDAGGQLGEALGRWPAERVAAVQAAPVVQDVLVDYFAQRGANCTACRATEQPAQDRASQGAEGGACFLAEIPGVNTPGLALGTIWNHEISLLLGLGLKNLLTRFNSMDWR